MEIECLPADIPNHIPVDVTELDMHQVLRVSGLPHDEKIKYLSAEDSPVAHVVSIREEVVATPEVEAAAVAVEGAPAEPEVAKKGKGETEAAGKAEGGDKAEKAKK